MPNVRTETTFLGARAGATGHVLFWGLMPQEHIAPAQEALFAPDLIRRLTYVYRLAQGGFRDFSTGHPVLAPDQLSDLGNWIFDNAREPRSEVAEITAQFLNRRKPLLICGEDSNLTAAVLDGWRHAGQPFQRVLLDARPYRGQPGGDLPERILQIGARGFLRDPAEPPGNLHFLNIRSVRHELARRLNPDLPVHLSIVARAFDPTVLGAVRDPVFGGLTYEQWREFCEALRETHLEIRSCDWSGFDPSLDNPSQTSALFASQILIDLTLLLSERPASEW